MSKQLKQQGMGRREFLIVTSGTALATMALGNGLVLPALAAPASGRTFALGYAEVDALQQSASRRGFYPNVSGSDSLTPDGDFLRAGARVAIRGGHAVAGNVARSMQLIVQYTAMGADGVTHAFPFYAWSYSSTNGMSSPVRFVVPVDGEQRLRFLLSSTTAGAQDAGSQVSRRNVLRAATAAENGTEPGAVTLSLLSGDGMPKLRRGYYILAPLADGQKAPSWSSLQLRQGNGLELYQSNGLDAVRADFDYVILFIDYNKGSLPDRGEHAAKSR